MHLLNSLNQQMTDRSYRFDGTLTNTSPRLVLPQALSRSFLSFQNTSPNVMWLEHGGARAIATISSGVVTGFTILNPGFGYVLPPVVQFKGGGGQFSAALTASAWDGRGQIDFWPTPSGQNLLVTPPIVFRPALATAILTNGVVTGFNISDGGAGYTNPPEVLLVNAPGDPYGCADPSNGSGSGVELVSGGTYFLNGTFCHTDAIALYTGTASSKYYGEYSP
jgi:hypothetical protein